MSEELNLILITAVVNGVIIFLFNTVINQIVKKLDNRYDYMKTVIMPYCDKLYEIYRLLHVDMEPCISKHQECDEVEILKITEKVYVKLLELDTYYDIYRHALGKDCIKKQQEKIRNWLYNDMKPALERNDRAKKIDAAIKLYNEIRLELRKEACRLTKGQM